MKLKLQRKGHQPLNENMLLKILYEVLIRVGIQVEQTGLTEKSSTRINLYLLKKDISRLVIDSSETN
jgi:hypothetical protein